MAGRGTRLRVAGRLHGQREPGRVANPLGESRGRHRAPEVEPLADVAPERLQLGTDGRGLDPFADYLDAELVREVDRGADDLAEAAAADDRAHDRAVQLELVDRPAAEALQRGEAGAEVIKGELDPGLRQLREEPGADGARPRFLAHLERDHPAGHLLLA